MAKQTRGVEAIHFQVPIGSIEHKGDTLMIAGYASTPDLDSYNDIVDPKAFSNEGALDRYMANPIILLSHDSDRVLGTMKENKVDAGGRWIKAELKYNVDNVFEQILDGVTKGFSIGFLPKKISLYNNEGVSLDELTQSELSALEYGDVKRVIEELEVFEVSVVNIPANPSTLFTLTKALKSYFNNLSNDTMSKAVGEIVTTETDNEEVKEEQVTTDGVEELQEFIENAEVVVLDEVQPDEVTEEEVVEEEVTVEEIVEEEIGEDVESEAAESAAPVEQAEDEKPTEEEKALSNEQLLEVVEKQSEVIDQLVGHLDTLTKAVGRIPVNSGLVMVNGVASKKEAPTGELAAARERATQ